MAIIRETNHTRYTWKHIEYIVKNTWPFRIYCLVFGNENMFCTHYGEVSICTWGGGGCTEMPVFPDIWKNISQNQVTHHHALCGFCMLQWGPILQVWGQRSPCWGFQGQASRCECLDTFVGSWYTRHCHHKCKNACFIRKSIVRAALVQMQTLSVNGP